MISLLAAYGVYAANTKTVKQQTTTDPVPYQLVEIASGFSNPLYVTHAGDGSGRLFVVQQTGRIRILENGEMLDPPFLDVSSLITTAGNEQGLLGLAFHPDYATNGMFFINYTDRNGDTVVARYHVSADNPNVADPASAEQILLVDQPFQNHNGGHLVFGPDGYLYVGLGDGGSQGDPNGNGQNTNVLLGKILRLDVDGETGYAIPPDNPFVGSTTARPEVWAYGLRNPWRFHFDRETGDLFIGDVGQNEWEEIDYQPATSTGGENYGWNAYEGSYPYSGSTTARDAVMPILEYNHNSGCSVTGGYVYRGQLVPDLQGYYIYGDFCTGLIWAAQQIGGIWDSTLSLQSGLQITSFGEDEDGELYLVDRNGSILRFEAAE
jgi:glucose/arabinose dehydrogenase